MKIIPFMHRVNSRFFHELHNLMIGLAPIVMDKRFVAVVLGIIIFACLIALQVLLTPPAATPPAEPAVPLPGGA